MSASAPAPLSLGRQLRLLRWRSLAWLALAAAAFLALDYGVGLYQHSLIDARRAARAALERRALFNLRADVHDLAMLGGRQYRLVLKLENAFPEQEFYVMSPDVRVYIQEGMVWREVPSRVAEASAEERVVKLTGAHTPVYAFDATVQQFEELLPGYMHVRIQNVMVVSPRREPQRDDLVERTDNYYVYLKPPGADDREVSRKNQFPDGHVPLWIPMPPH